jgi:hypothetical protein
MISTGRKGSLPPTRKCEHSRKANHMATKKGKMTEAKDKAGDKKAKVKEGSKKDSTMDVAAGMPPDAPRYQGRGRYK